MVSVFPQKKQIDLANNINMKNTDIHLCNTNITYKSINKKKSAHIPTYLDKSINVPIVYDWLCYSTGTIITTPNYSVKP